MRPVAILALLVGAVSVPVLAGEYTFTVENNGDQRIVKIEVSEDGRSWGLFDIGSGIASGESVQLEWDESTDDGDCEWQFRATFSGGDVLASDWIDFCEDDVVLTFEFDS